MDKNAIKNYAVWARREMIARVSQRALIYGITATDAGDPNADSVNGHLLSQKEKQQRQALIYQIKEKGYEQVMEEVAYTWFNRFAALRFMEVNGYLPSHVRVFTNDAGEFKPQILAEAIHLELEGLDMNRVYELENANKSDELFKYLLIVQCNALNSILPGMFQKIDDYTELLLPDYLLREGSVIERMVTTIPEVDWTDQVQIIGWLYQYYNTEPKKKVFDDLKKNIKITKEKIPAATQLFTPDWIVHYMVENSLGRLWLEGHPNDTLKSKWKYYLDEAEQEPEVQAQLDSIRKEYATLKPEDIRVIDPCMGSGHILCVLFDTLVQIYEDYGYTAREAVVKIIENNLWGLDIDERAAQLSYFAVMMKARQYDRNFFIRKVQPHVYGINETNDFRDDYIHTNNDFFLDSDYKETLDYLIEAFIDAKEYGSILQLDKHDYIGLKNALETTSSIIQENTNMSLWSTVVLPKLPHLVEQALALSQKYDVVVTNPPYMANKGINSKLSDLIQKKYDAYKSDLFATLVIRCKSLCRDSGFLGFLTPYVWMFIQSYESLRRNIYTTSTIEGLIQFEYSAFEEATVPICTYILRNHYINKKGVYLRLTDFRGGMEIQRLKALEGIANHKCGYYFNRNQNVYDKVPGAPIAFWASDNLFSAFVNGTALGELAEPRGGLSTTDNAKFLRYWYEVDICNIAFNVTDTVQTESREEVWCPIAKGGDYRKWYGNNDYVVKWYHNGREIKHHVVNNPNDPNTTSWSRRIFNYTYYFHPCVTWSGISSGSLSVRMTDHQIFGGGGKALFSNNKLEFYCALLNSNVALNFLTFISPTLNYESGHIAKIPVLDAGEKLESIITITNNCCELSHEDWDSFETSWDFKEHPFIAPVCMSNNKNEIITIKQSYDAWKSLAEERFVKLKKNEEELNRIFIEIYGLRDELTPEVEDKDITVRHADLQRDIRSFISYAVGCMFGRYSLDVPCLAYAGGAWDTSKYTSFLPDKDAIIPICDDEYFEDDIVGRFVRFVETVYGKETLEENLRFIADALGGKGTSRQVIRSYFINDFYPDHLKVYQKRPIYWLFDSGKKNGFKCLIYMHRYQPDTIARIRTDYVHEQQARYRTSITNLEQRMNNASSSERVKLSKQLSKLQDQAEELRVYEEKIHHLADQMISIELDDGVNYNYQLFKDVLAKIK